jgi:hypothetical protein
MDGATRGAEAVNDIEGMVRSRVRWQEGPHGGKTGEAWRHAKGEALQEVRLVVSG